MPPCSSELLDLYIFDMYSPVFFIRQVAKELITSSESTFLYLCFIDMSSPPDQTYGKWHV